MSDTVLRASMLLLVLILPLSALMARRATPMTMLRYAGAWIAIAGMLYGIVLLFT